MYGGSLLDLRAALAASPDIEVRSGPVAPWLRYIAVAEVQRAPRAEP